MTYAFRAFELQTGNARAASLRRCEFFAWIACILFINDLARIEVESSSGIFPALIESVTSKSIFYYLGIYAVIRLLLEGDADRQVGSLDIGLGLAACVISVLPFKSVVWLVATLWAFYLLVSGGSDRKVKAAAVVLLALATNRLWGPIFFDSFESALLHADAALAGTALIFSHPDLTWHGNVIGAAEGHRIIILSGCSSFHNISMGLLCWAALTKLARPTWDWSDAAFAFGVVAVVIGLNVSRLYLMALSYDQYIYWHNGFGSQLYEIAATLAVLTISLWGACRNPEAAT